MKWRVGIPVVVRELEAAEHVEEASAPEAYTQVVYFVIDAIDPVHAVSLLSDRLEVICGDP